MLNKLLANSRSAVLVLLAWLLLFTGACNKTDTPEPTSAASSYLPVLQEKPYIKALFYGVMNFAFYHTEFAFPVEFAVVSVPVSWMGNIFDGYVSEAGPGEDVTDQVHGNLSEDGQAIDTIFFSRQIIRPGNNTGLFYRITLRNIPLGVLDQSQVSGAAIYYKEGDIQKYVTKIEYAAGKLENGEIVSDTFYLSTDWKNNQTGLKPILKLTFETQPSEIFGEVPVGAPGMGMGR